MTTYTDSYTGNGPYTTDDGFNPLHAFRQWQAGKIHDTNARIDANMGKAGDNYGNEGRGLTARDSGANDYPQLAVGAAPTGAGRPDDIQGWAQRNNPVPKAYRAPQGYASTGGNDEYSRMADQLYGLSQQRAGTEGSIGVDGFMRQLNNIRALGDSTPMGGIGILGDGGIEAQNAEKTQRWAMEDLIKKHPRALGAFIQAQSNNAINERNVSGRLDEIRLQEQLRGGTQLGLEEARGKNQLAAYGLQGRNQLANTELGYGMQGRNQLAADDRRYGFEENKQLADHMFRQPLQDAQVSQLRAQEGYYGGLERRANAEASPDLLSHRYFADMVKSNPPTNTKDLTNYWTMSQRMANPQAMQDLVREYRESKQPKNKAAKDGYADGGVVKETPEQLMERMNAKYGVGTGGGQSAQPQPPVPQPQQAPIPVPRQETMAEKLRRMATGNLDKRMEGYADGGPIMVGGRQVLGAGDGKSDSIPAVIDGGREAALSSGEFVLPVETVRHFGLQRLNKMVEQSRKGLDAGRRQA